MKVFNTRILLILIHFVLGAIIYTSFISKIYSSVVLFVAVFSIIKNKNENNEAFTWAFYYMSAEVLLRMSNGVFSWEFVKYVTILLLVLGIMVEKRVHGIPIQYLLYILLISIGMAFTEIPAGKSFRSAWMFNLSGPFTLGISAIYFYKRKIEFSFFKTTLFYALLPIFSMLSLLYFRTPSLKEITFNTVANFDTSGGFGPNQVATALGLGIFIMPVLMILKEKITGYIFIDLLLFFYLVFRGLITFSRGGIITGFLAIAAFLIFYFFSSKKSAFLIIRSLIVFLVLGVITWNYSTDLTGGLLENRYLGKNVAGEKKEDISSGRIDIFKAQLESFYDNAIFGIGVGSGKYKRQEQYDGHITAASHNEMSRLIEEHGLIGIAALLVIFISSINNIMGHELQYRGLLTAFVVLWFLTINHSAMRIAFPGFIYGLSLIRITNDEEGIVSGE